MIRNISHIKYFSLIINNLLDNRNILLERELIACIERGNLLKIIFYTRETCRFFSNCRTLFKAIRGYGKGFLFLS